MTKFVMVSRSELIQRSILEFDLPFLINLPDDHYYVKYAGLDVEVRLRHVPVSSPGRGLQPGVAFSPDAHIIGDRWGRLAYTKLNIVFNHEIYVKFHILIHTYLLQKSVELVRRILEVCRIVTGDHYIHDITGADIMTYNISHYDLNGNKMPGDLTGFLGSGVTLTTGGADNISADKLDVIKDMLEKDTKIPLNQELLLNAGDYYFYGNYKVAVIEAETAFEIFIHEFVSKHYRSKHKPENDIKNILEQTGFKNLLIDHIRILSKFDFANSTQYSNWEKNTYELRNKIVHQGKKDVSADGSLKAISTVSGTISFLNNLMP